VSTPPGRATSDDELLASLQASEARLRAALEASFDSFFFLEPIRDEAGKIVDFSYVDLNAHGASILHLPREQVIGQTFRALNPSIAVEPILERCARVLETGAPLREEFSIARADGSVVWVYHHIFPMGRGVASTVHDITERKRAEEERRIAEEALRQTQQRLAFSERMASVGTLAAGAAHEINNPLAAMIMNLGFVAESLSALLATPPGPERSARRGCATRPRWSRPSSRAPSGCGGSCAI
jgi:PAS domain S-box-containing protein